MMNTGLNKDILCLQDLTEDVLENIEIHLNTQGKVVTAKLWDSAGLKLQIHWSSHCELSKAWEIV